MDILVLDLDMAVFFMESVRLKLSPRLRLTPGCMEDMDLDMDIPILDTLVLDILVFMDGVAKKSFK